MIYDKTKDTVPVRVRYGMAGSVLYHQCELKYRLKLNHDHIAEWVDKEGFIREQYGDAYIKTMENCKYKIFVSSSEFRPYKLFKFIELDNGTSEISFSAACDESMLNKYLYSALGTKHEWSISSLLNILDNTINSSESSLNILNKIGFGAETKLYDNVRYITLLKERYIEEFIVDKITFDKITLHIYYDSVCYEDKTSVGLCLFSCSAFELDFYHKDLHTDKRVFNDFNKFMDYIKKIRKSVL